MYRNLKKNYAYHVRTGYVCRRVNFEIVFFRIFLIAIFNSILMLVSKTGRIVQPPESHIYCLHSDCMLQTCTMTKRNVVMSFYKVKHVLKMKFFHICTCVKLLHMIRKLYIYTHI